MEGTSVMEAEPSPLRCCSEPKAPLELEPELEPATALERWAGGGLRWVANRSASFPAQHWSHWSPSPLPPRPRPLVLFGRPLRATQSRPPASLPCLLSPCSPLLLFRFLLCEWNAQLTAPHAPRRIAETEAWPPLRPLNPIEHEQAGELELEKKKKRRQTSDRFFLQLFEHDLVDGPGRPCAAHASRAMQPSLLVCLGIDDTEIDRGHRVDTRTIQVPGLSGARGRFR